MNNSQVFVRNPHILDLMIKTAAVTATDSVIDIGSGDGRLTEKIAEKAGKVYAIERDLNLLDSSKIKLSRFNNVDFIHADVLSIELPADANKIVSNLPYNISSPLTDKILRFMNERKGSLAILMYQKEFAERMLAVPGFNDYSMLSVFVQYFCTAKLVSHVSKSNFKPVPAVDSSIVLLKPRNINIDERFLDFCRLIFQHKKKNLYSAIIDGRGGLKLKTKTELRERLNGASMPLKTKVFYLSVQKLLNVYKEAARLGIW